MTVEQRLEKFAKDMRDKLRPWQLKLSAKWLYDDELARFQDMPLHVRLTQTSWDTCSGYSMNFILRATLNEVWNYISYNRSHKELVPVLKELMRIAEDGSYWGMNWIAAGDTVAEFYLDFAAYYGEFCDLSLESPDVFDDAWHPLLTSSYEEEPVMSPSEGKDIVEAIIQMILKIDPKEVLP